MQKLIAAPPPDWPEILTMSAAEPLAHYGSDTNYALLRSALTDAQVHGPYDFVIFVGDALRHNFASAFAAAGGQSSGFAAFALKTQMYVIDELRRRFGVPVIFALGNDDSDCGDYRLAPASHYLAATAREIDALTPSPGVRSRFAAGGYYTVAHPAVDNREIVVLNSVLWSPSYVSCAATTSDPGLAEMDWLAGELAAARHTGQRVTLVMHVPPGIDAYGSAQQGNCAAIPLMKSMYATRLNALLRTYQDTVQVALAGHTHMDDFRLDAADPESIPVRVNPAISPIFGNNPAYGIYSYDRRTAEPLDFTAFSLPLRVPTPVWLSEYRFSTAYGVPAFNRPGVRSALASIDDTGAALTEYEHYYASSAASPISATNAALYTCAQTHFEPGPYSSCACPR